MKKVLAILFAAIILVSSVTVISVSAATKEDYIEPIGTPVCDVVSPLGGGSRFVKVIKDGFIGQEGDPISKQYDTYLPTATAHEAYFGYTFEEEFSVCGIDFYEGMHYTSGGWFANGTIRVEAYIGDEWQSVTLTNTPNYPTGNSMAEFGSPYEKYEFRFEPVNCTGIRIIGDAGGSKYYISCSELRVLAEVDEDFHAIDPEKAARLEAAQKRYEENGYLEGFATAITNAVVGGTSGGSQDVNTINDGVTVGYDNTNNRLQFDTYNASTKINTLEYIGYTFDAPYKIDRMIYQSGMVWSNGGWFAFGFEVEALIHGEWISLEDVSVTPEYPDSNTGSDFKSYETYTIELDGIVCEGIRLLGLAGGAKNFISCTEMTLVGDMNPDLEEYNSGSVVKPGESDTDTEDEDNRESESGKAQTSAPEKGDNTEDSGSATTASTGEKKGCGSSVSVGICALVTALSGAAVTVMKKRTVKNVRR